MRTQTLHKLSEEVIPAVRGEFYSYGSEFSRERPLYFMMKCKANKARPREDAQKHPGELDLSFLFGNVAQVCSPNRTRIASAGITSEEFDNLRRQKDGQALTNVCRAAIERNGTVKMTLKANAIIAVVTQSGKYGLFQVKELAPSLIRIEACHILP